MAEAANLSQKKIDLKQIYCSSARTQKFESGFP